jgi:hypothetical protein
VPLRSGLSRDSGFVLLLADDWLENTDTLPAGSHALACFA